MWCICGGWPRFTWTRSSEYDVTNHTETTPGSGKVWFILTGWGILWGWAPAASTAQLCYGSPIGICLRLLWETGGWAGAPLSVLVEALVLCTYSFISDVWLLLARSSADTDTQSSAWCLYLGEWKPWPLALEDRAKEVSSVSLTSSFMVFDGSEVPSSWSYGRMQK